MFVFFPGAAGMKHERGKTSRNVVLCLTLMLQKDEHLGDVSQKSRLN